ncbi:FANCI [Branchiostoma lanceolatum]|uniref:FANCI protein n=1 Tax=Branchiostoma lanceolatum TaxID=7740 RepID=A0A8S4MMA1_BRALA|nr:FANCI [Branchiostoma lanceolatum]
MVRSDILEQILNRVVTKATSPVTHYIAILTYINNLPERISSTSRLFADDTAVYRLITCPEDPSKLQDDLDKLEDWESHPCLAATGEAGEVTANSFGASPAVQTTDSTPSSPAPSASEDTGQTPSLTTFTQCPVPPQP